MLTRIVVTLAMAAMSATALGQAKVIVELVPQHPGPYKGGESFLVDVWLQNQEPSDVEPKFVQFDFSQTDSALSLDTTFGFDFTSISDPYASAPQLPVPIAWNLIDCVCPGLFLSIPGNGSLHIGSIIVRLPTAPGIYRVDALNADEADPKQGALLLVGLKWRAFTGEIGGGRFSFLVGLEGIPTLAEWGVATFALLLLGAGTLAIRSRCQLCKRGAVS